MKAIKLFIALLIGSISLFSSCEPDYDIPPATRPQATLKANTTILDLKEAFTGDLDTVGYLTGTTPYIIEGVVIGNDVSGNIYKNIMIQDSTAAITVSIDGTNLFNSYRIGQKLVINCTGLCVGKYRNLQQLGYTGTSGISFIPLAMFEEHVQLSGWPDSPFDTLQVTIKELPAAFPALMKYQSQLVEFKSVYFEEAGDVFAISQKSTSRTLKDTLGNSITVYNSGYSNFYSDILPEGLGNVVGILSYFNNGYQLLLRSRSDVFDFNGTPVPEPPTTAGDGTQENPYTVTEALTLGSKTGVWMKAYIVGCVQGQVIATGAVFTAPFPSASNILLGADASEKNVADLMPAQLSFKGNDANFNPATDPRTQLNLQDNPGNQGKLVLIKGDITPYFNVPGVKNITEFMWLK